MKSAYRRERKISAYPPAVKSAPALTTQNLTFILAISICLLACKAPASITLYQASDSTNNLVPDAIDPTPNRPAGEMIGNTITIIGTEGLSGATVKIGTSDASIAPQDVTLSLYMNDGAPDPGGSGLLQPGTLIDSETDTQVSLSAGVVPVTFSFPSLLMPATFTFVISFTPGSTGSQYVGPMSDNSAPQIGSADNTLWFGTGAPGAWTTNNTWAVADGAAVNYLDATFFAADVAPVPEPANLLLLTFGSAAVWLHYQRHRRTNRK